VTATVGAPVSPAPVWDVINGFSSYWALRTALDLGVFDALAGGKACDGAELARAVGAADPTPVTVLADTLIALGLLTSDDDGRYRLGGAADRYLTSGSPASMAALVRHSPGPARSWPELAHTIRRGSPDPSLAAELAAFYPQLAPATAPTQAAVAAAVGSELERRGRWPDSPVIVDLGCGSGAWLATLLGQRPDATGVGVELPGVLPVAERTAADAAVRERLTLIGGDYLTVALPVERADVVLLAHVLRAEPAERAQRLLRRAIELAGPDGVVVVADYPRPDDAADAADGGPATDRTAACSAAKHELLLSLTMLASTPGAGVTVAALRAWAGAAGAELITALEPIPRQHVYLIAAADRTERS
jgi:SAM-dependent methyltransferase